MPSNSKVFESTNFEDAKAQKLKSFPRTLQILFKKAFKSRKSPSWMVLRGKERRKNIKQIMHTLGSRKKVINPYSAEQFQSFLNAVQEHGLEDEGIDVITEPETTSVDFQEMGFDFGTDYGCSEFLDLEKESQYGKNRAFYDSNLMQLSSVEETLDAFSKEKLF